MREFVLSATTEDRRIATLAAIAIGLTVAEAALPSPVPGVKPGLANIVILLVLLQHGFKTAAWVSLIRLLAGSLILGTFLSPGFWLATAGTIASLLAMFCIRHLPEKTFGPVTLSTLTAFAHIGGQLLLAWAWLLPVTGIASLVPLFALSALVFGTVNGLIVAHLIAGSGSMGAKSVHA